MSKKLKNHSFNQKQKIQKNKKRGFVSMLSRELLCERFRGFFPVVIDIETSGFDAKKNAILELAATTLKMDAEGFLQCDQTLNFFIEPFEGAILDPASLAFTGIDPFNPMRKAISVSEKTALKEIFKLISQGIKAEQCNRAILVAHNSHFDLGFLLAACERAKIKKNPFHPFSTFDTASLSGLMYGQTVLAKACRLAGIDFDEKEAHSALYDTQKTAFLFCQIVNRLKELKGWPLVEIEA